MKAGPLELPKHLGSVGEACKMMGYSRDSFSRICRTTLHQAGHVVEHLGDLVANRRSAPPQLCLAHDAGRMTFSAAE